MTKFRIFDREKPTALERAVAFSDKILMLTDSFRANEKLLAKILPKTAINMMMRIADMISRVRVEEKRVFLNGVRGDCLKCLALLALLKERKVIGSMTHASMKADIEGIWEAAKEEVAGQGQ